MIHERIAVHPENPAVATAEAAFRTRVSRFIEVFNGPFGKVVADLIGEGQSEPAILQELNGKIIGPRRQAAIALIERGRLNGEFTPDTNPERIVDAIFGAMYYNFLLRLVPLTQEYGQALVEEVVGGHRTATLKR